MKCLLLVSIAVSGAAALLSYRRDSNWTIGQIVKTTSGPVQGHAAINKTEVSVYLGIPYALPPVGDLRWAPPEKFLGSAQLNGSSFVSPGL